MLDDLLRAGAAVLASRAESPEVRTFRELGAAGRLHFQRCDDCRYLRYPPASRCPECLSASAHWDADSGAGSVWSFCVYHRSFHPAFADLVPYNVALIELDSGPRLITNVVGVVGVSIGMRGIAAPRSLPGGGTLVYFTPEPDLGVQEGLDRE